MIKNTVLSKKSLSFLAVSVWLGLFSGEVFARDWTCQATFDLINSNISYTIPSWNESGGAFVDREKRCRQRIEGEWLNNGQIWSLLVKQGLITANQASTYCKTGGNFRVQYGFDQRRKAWNFTGYSIKPRCKTPCEPVFVWG